MFTYVCMLKLGRTEPSRVLLSRTSDLFTDRGWIIGTWELQNTRYSLPVAGKWPCPGS